ncbi:MAG TPA: hypothetical protein DDZ68_11060 [Parvularcula sp.]|nr:hypothetical protein [Parvularcula sp.]HBS34427.1 hypothetical protein [Parvularcula sp.]
MVTTGFAFWRNLPAKANERAPHPGRRRRGAILTPVFFIFVCAGATAGLLWAERIDSARWRAVFKPLASLAFVLAGVSAGALQTPMGTAILAGLVLSAIGDGLLIPRQDRLFLAGMAAFGLAHLAYSSGFLFGAVRFGYEAAIAGGLTLGAGLFFLRPLRGAMGAMAAPVALYMLVISAMVTLAVGHFMAAGTDAALRLAIGAGAFAASDLAVARDQFGKRDYFNRAWGLPLYFGAQCLIATAV